MKWFVIAILAILGIVAAAAIVVIATDDSDSQERADYHGQGGNGPLLAEGGASLVRFGDGIQVGSVTPTPTPGSYEYPSGDMVPEGSPADPEVLPGGPEEPEVFTLWAFTFNYPDLCTEDACDFDDLAQDAPAGGGVFQVDGRVVDGEVMEFAGSVRLGQQPGTGSVFENPLGAEIHLAIAPHGKMLEGMDLWRQLNGPLGNPSLWWAATFLP